jgi:hypothetical protein
MCSAYGPLTPEINNRVEFVTLIITPDGEINERQRSTDT